MMFSLTKLSLFAVCALALGGALPVVGRADTVEQKSSRATIEASYKKVAQAIMRKDVKPYAALEAADFQCYRSSGKVLNREQDIASMQQFLASIVSIPKAEYKILSFTWRGPDAIISVQNTSVIVMAQGKKKVRVENVDISRDYWGRTAQGWQIRQTVQKVGKTWVDGKRIK